MLGRVVRDPDGLEGPPGETLGLGLLDVETGFAGDKRLARVGARHDAAIGLALSGYQIHVGRTSGPDAAARPFAFIAQAPDGACLPCGQIAGSYLHGLFLDDALRAAWLAGLGADPSGLGCTAGIEATLDRLAARLEAHLDVPGLFALAAP